MQRFVNVLILCRDGKARHVYTTKQQIVDLIGYLDQQPSFQFLNGC